MKKTHRRIPLLGTLFLSLGIFSITFQVSAQTCIGTQTRSATCVDPSGAAVDERYCTENNLPKPETEQECTYSCPPPETNDGANPDVGEREGFDSSGDGTGGGRI